MRYYLDSIPLNTQTTSYNKKAVVKAPVNKEVSYSYIDILVSSSDELEVGSNRLISDCNKWSIYNKELFSNINKSWT
jgi:hypothetical protein